MLRKKVASRLAAKTSSGWKGCATRARMSTPSGPTGSHTPTAATAGSGRRARASAIRAGSMNEYVCIAYETVGSSVASDPHLERVSALVPPQPRRECPHRERGVGGRAAHRGRQPAPLEVVQQLVG